MTDSLIPYTFVPGTKARASEVNANFAAVADAINSSNSAITDLSSEMNTALEGRLDVSMSNSHNMTNCIVAAPNGVVTYSNLTITAKSGLQVLMPNGKNTDGTLKNIVYTLSSDISSTDTISSGTRIFAVTSSGELLLLYENCFLQGDNSSKPTTLADVNTYIYFAVDENKMYITSGSTTADWSQINLCTLGSYGVSNSTIYNFNSKKYFSFTDLVNSDLSDLSDAGELHFLRTGNSRMVLSSTGSICTIGGRKYYKSYTDKCICAVASASDGNIAPIFVGETERSVTGYDDNNTTPRFTGSLTWKGKIYYYLWDSKMSGGSSVTSQNIPFSRDGYSDGVTAAKAILEMYYDSTCKTQPLISYVSGSGGYRVWNDGYKEEWGHVSAGSTSNTLSYPKAFANTYYVITFGEQRGDVPTKNIVFSGKSKTGCTVKVGDTSTAFDWYACGY